MCLHRAATKRICNHLKGKNTRFVFFPYFVSYFIFVVLEDRCATRITSVVDARSIKLPMVAILAVAALCWKD